jgi:hypothetical protein
MDVPVDIVFAVDVAVNLTVPLLWVNPPLVAIHDPPTANVPDGRVDVPASNRTLFVLVAEASRNDHEPAVPLKYV